MSLVSADLTILGRFAVLPILLIILRIVVAEQQDPSLGQKALLLLAGILCLDVCGSVLHCLGTTFLKDAYRKSSFSSLLFLTTIARNEIDLHSIFLIDDLRSTQIVPGMFI